MQLSTLVFLVCFYYTCSLLFLHVSCVLLGLSEDPWAVSWVFALEMPGSADGGHRLYLVCDGCFARLRFSFRACEGAGSLRRSIQKGGHRCDVCIDGNGDR